MVLVHGAHCIASSTVCLQLQAVRPADLKGLPYVPFPFYLRVFVNKENIKVKLKHVSLASSIPNPTSAGELGQ
jgi:hypothetical protein